MTIDLQIGDCREILLKYPDNHFDCIMTSPPYWGLRDYDTNPLIFDGTPECEHEWNESNFCINCGAWKGQLGLEPTPELFIKHLADIFDIIKPKLADTGNCFINLGDTYWGGGNASGHTEKTVQFGTSHTLGKNYITKPLAKGKNFKDKCLCMIPQRFAWEMIQRGWILRNEIIWHKKNAMPESVRDRLKKSHEIIWHFVKQQKYYYDLDVIREPLADSSIKRITQVNVMNQTGGSKQDELRGKPDSGNASRCNKMVQSLAEKYVSGNKSFGKNPGDISEIGIDDLSKTELKIEIVNLIQEWKNMHPEDWNNPSDVYNVSITPYSKAHFATFPLKLVEKPILAGCPIDGWVLDPFAGSGTVGEFCTANHRNVVLIELNDEYESLIVGRNNLKEIPLNKFFSYVK